MPKGICWSTSERSNKLFKTRTNSWHLDSLFTPDQCKLSASWRACSASNKGHIQRLRFGEEEINLAANKYTIYAIYILSASPDDHTKVNGPYPAKHSYCTRSCELKLSSFQSRTGRQRGSRGLAAPCCISSQRAIAVSPPLRATASGVKVTRFGRWSAASHDSPDVNPGQCRVWASGEQAPSRLCRDFCKDLYLLVVQSSFKKINK